MRNRFFNQYNTSGEQGLLEDLIIESIKIYGTDAYYLPKTHVNLDLLYKEDTSMKFDDAIPIEIYLKTYDTYLGQNDFISKFGLMIDEQLTFSIAKKRFHQALQPGVMTEYGYNIIDESGDELLVEAGYDYSTLLRPQEGDLVYFPLTKDLFEIKFVESIETLFQLGKLYTYELRCQKYEYTSDKLDTDIADIDDIETDYSMDTSLMPQMLFEDDDGMIMEDNGLLLTEGSLVEAKDPGAQNDFIQNSIQDEDILDFSEKNPFSETRIF